MHAHVSSTELCSSPYKLAQIEGHPVTDLQLEVL